MVFQQFNLMESRTVWGNLAFPLTVAGVGKAEQQKRISEFAALRRPRRQGARPGHRPVRRAEAARRHRPRARHQPSAAARRRGHQRSRPGHHPRRARPARQGQPRAWASPSC
ncbi:hypothetical protein [Nocardioides convexus]|uniref:hypothetical protein n=1 Tax=Nocardioides convexus TaxID=2712224 RepID=UPI003100CB91